MYFPQNKINRQQSQVYTKTKSTGFTSRLRELTQKHTVLPASYAAFYRQTYLSFSFSNTENSFRSTIIMSKNPFGNPWPNDLISSSLNVCVVLRSKKTDQALEHALLPSDARGHTTKEDCH